MQMTGYENQSASLTGKMLKDLLSGLAVGAYMIFLLYLGGMNMLQQYFSTYYTGEAELVEELGEYARRRRLGATDVRKLIPWIEDKGIREFKVARKGWLLFDASYPGVI
ncbi:MAG: sensor histidine kinase, partial [Eubacterium sp.]|nr:sensor histidine kinase [Eubacterium sp.]